MKYFSKHGTWSIFFLWFYLFVQTNGFHKSRLTTALRRQPVGNVDSVDSNYSSQNIPRGGFNDSSMNDSMTKNDMEKKEEEFIHPQYSLPRNNNDFLGDDDNSSNSCKQGLILMDGFCPYHGGYLSHQAKIAYNAGIVHCVSDYVLNCLMRDINDGGDSAYDNDDDDSEEMKNQYYNARIPKSKENLKGWVEAIPFQISGIICESDSGLDDAENLGVGIGLFPNRHDGYNRKYFSTTRNVNQKKNY